MEQTTKFRTFNVLKNGIRYGKVTAATINQDDEMGVFHVGLAFCSPLDKFSKFKSQVMSEGRAKNPRTFIVVRRDKDKKVVDYLKELIINHSANIEWMNGYYSQEARKVVLPKDTILV